MTVAKELTELLWFFPNEGETPQQFARRLALKANDLSDDDWAVLENPTQRWVTIALEAIERGQDIPLPEGIDEVFDKQTGGDALVKLAKPIRAKKLVKLKQLEPVLAKEGVRRGPKPRFAFNGKIKLLVNTNPKRKGSRAAARFDVYTSGMTVAEALAKKITFVDLRNDAGKEYISIS